MQTIIILSSLLVTGFVLGLYFYERGKNKELAKLQKKEKEREHKKNETKENLIKSNHTDSVVSVLDLMHKQRSK